jgi:hypothetical protein
MNDFFQCIFQGVCIIVGVTKTNRNLEYIPIYLEKAFGKFEVNVDAIFDGLKGVNCQHSCLTSYHSKSTKHDCNETSSTRSTNELKVLTGHRQLVTRFGLSVVPQDPLDIMHETLDDEKRRKALHTTSIECKDARNMPQRF